MAQLTIYILGGSYVFFFSQFHMADANVSFQPNGCLDKLVSYWNVKSLNHPVKHKKVCSHLKHLGTETGFL